MGARLGIAKYSRGIPRNINTLCFNAMSVAYGMGAKQVDAKMVQEAAADVEMESLLPKSQKLPKVVMPKRAPAVVIPIRPLAVPKVQPVKNSSAANRMVPAFAACLVLMLLATFSWIAWDRGEKTPPFDVLMAASSPAALKTAPSGSVPQREPAAIYVRSARRRRNSLSRGEGDPVQPASVPTLAANPKAPVPKLSQRFGRRTSIPAGLSQNDEILTVVVEQKGNGSATLAAIRGKVRRNRDGGNPYAESGIARCRSP